MANTLKEALPVLSQTILKEWTAETKLVKTCSNEYEGEFDLNIKEIDIPVFGHISIHKTSIKEGRIKPAPVEFKTNSTIRVILDKGRYNHWGELNLEKLINALTAEDSEHRARLVKDWALDADEELAIAIAKLPAKQQIDISAALGGSGLVDKTNIIKVLDILKAKAKAGNQKYQDFELFVSEKLGSIARDAQIEFKADPAKAAFNTGYVGRVNGVELTEVDIEALVKRNATTGLVEAEYGIWKTRDGVQYVVPFKNTISYDLQPNEQLGGGTAYQTIEYYDFFNLYPQRLYAVQLKYASGAALPTFTGSNPTANVMFPENLKAVFGTVK